MRFNLAVAAGLAASVLPAFAAEPPVSYGPPVVVTATRFEEPVGRHPIGVQTITAEGIRNSTAVTVPDLLRQYAGIHTRDNSGSPNVQVDLRGFGVSSDQNMLVLLDGARISENEQTTVNWSGIPLSAIERIEILRGSGAVLYGGGATGGTINIVTKAPEPNRRSASALAGIGTYGTTDAAVGASVAGPHLGMTFHGSRLDTDNYRDNNQLRQSNGLADVRWRGAGSSLSLKVGADDQSLRLPGALSEAQIMANPRQAATPNDYSERWGGFANLGGERRIGEAVLAANLIYREKNIHASIIGSPIDSDMEVWQFSPRLKLPHALGGFRNSLVAGLDLDDWNFINTTTIFGAPRQPSAYQRNGALYFQNTTEAGGGWTIAAGARHQRVEYGVVDLANPAQGDRRERHLNAWELAVRHRLSAATSAYGKAGASFRLPNVNDVYNLFTGVVALLEPQTSHDYEIGIEHRAATGAYRLALYLMDFDNKLYFDPATFVNRNLPPTRRTGAELEGRWRWGASLDAFATYTLAMSEFRSGGFGGVPVAGKEVPLVPRHAFNVGAGWAFAPRARADAVLRYVGEQVFDGDETNTFGRRMPAYTVVDVKVTYESRGWRLSGGVKNLLDEQYFTYGVFDPFTPTYFAYPAPERALFASAEYRFR